MIMNVLMLASAGAQQPALGLLLALSAPHVACSAPASLISEIPDADEDEEAEEEDGHGYREAGIQESMYMYGDDGDAYFAGAYGGEEGFFGEGMFGDGMFDDELFGGNLEEQAQMVSVLLTKFDKDTNHRLSKEELRAALNEQAQRYADWGRQSAEEETQRLASEVDEDGDGRISLGELEAAGAELYLPHENHHTRAEAFAFADADKDGFLSTAELALLLFPENSSRFEDFRKVRSTRRGVVMVRVAPGSGTRHGVAELKPGCRVLLVGGS